MSEVLQQQSSADEQLTHKLVEELHRVGMKVQTSLSTDRTTGDRTVSLLALDQTTGERSVASGPDWCAAAPDESGGSTQLATSGSGISSRYF